jgi:hypothetical protein
VTLFFSRKYSNFCTFTIVPLRVPLTAIENKDKGENPTYHHR